MVFLYSMVHVHNEVTNQDSQRRKSLKFKPVDIASSILLEKRIMVLTKTQNILILKQSLLHLIALLELLTVLLEYIDLFLSKAFLHVGSV